MSLAGICAVGEVSDSVSLINVLSLLIWTSKSWVFSVSLGDILSRASCSSLSLRNLDLKTR